MATGVYLSTDPYAGDPESAPEYLSTDPNAGDTGPATRLGGPSATISAAPERGLVSTVRDWLVGAASDTRIADADRAVARAAGIGLQPTKREMAEAALAGLGAATLPAAAVAAPVATAAGLGGGLAGGAIGSRVGEAVGEAVGPGVGATFGAPVGETVGGIVGGAAAGPAARVGGRAAQRAGRAVYARGFEKPAPTAVVSSRAPAAARAAEGVTVLDESGNLAAQPVALTRRAVADAVIDAATKRGEGIPVRASKVHAQALSRLHADIRTTLLADLESAGLSADAAAAAVQRVPHADTTKPSTLRHAIQPLLAQLRRQGKTAEAAAVLNNLDTAVGVARAALKTTNLRIGKPEAFAIGHEALPMVGLHALSPGYAAALQAFAALRQPLPRRALGAALIRGGRAVESAGRSIDITDPVTRARARRWLGGSPESGGGPAPVSGGGSGSTVAGGSGSTVGAAASSPAVVADSLPTSAALLDFAARSGAKPGAKVWLALDKTGAPTRVLTADQARAAARAGEAVTWVRNVGDPVAAATRRKAVEQALQGLGVVDPTP